MALHIHVSNYVVPIAAIDAYHEGGFHGFLNEWFIEDGSIRDLAYDVSSFDDFIFLYRTMGSESFSNCMPIERWNERGFQLRNADETEFQDGCIVSNPNGPNLPCSWLNYDPTTRVAWHVDDPKGPTSVYPVPKLINLVESASLKVRRIYLDGFNEPSDDQVIEKPKKWWRFW